MLGDQASASERRRELGAGGREPDVAQEGWQGRCRRTPPLMAAMTGLGIVVGPLACRRRPGPAGALAGGVGADALQHVHVGAGAETPTGAGDHDRPHLRIGAGLVEEIEVAGLELTASRRSGARDGSG